MDYRLYGLKVNEPTLPVGQNTADKWLLVPSDYVILRHSWIYFLNIKNYDKSLFFPGKAIVQGFLETSYSSTGQNQPVLRTYFRPVKIRGWYLAILSNLSLREDDAEINMLN